MVSVAIVCALTESTSENCSPLLTQLPVLIDPLAGRLAANSTPDTQICSELYPGAFQLSIVWPTVVPAASVIVLGFAVKVSWPLPGRTPNTPTPLRVPTYTFPLAIIG